ncbi:MAG: energy transducer TonB [Acidobacteriota bacterium]
MRRLLVALLVSLPTLSFAATLESRSLQHVMTVEPVAGSNEYIVRVTDIVSGQRLAQVRMALKNDVAEAAIDDADLRVRIRLKKFGTGISARVEVERGEKVIDFFESLWRPTPQNALRVGGDVKAPVVITRVNPFYPEEARQARISGIVILEVLIDKTGAVKDATVLKGLPNGLSEAAVEAVRQWMFVPATKDGQAVDVVFNLTINFRLDGPKKPRH